MKLNDKKINYGNLSRFYEDLKGNDLTNISTQINNQINLIYDVIQSMHPEEMYLNFTSNKPNTKVRIVHTNIAHETPSEDIDVEYSFDMINWKPAVADVDIIIPNVGDRIFFRGNNPNGFVRLNQEQTNYTHIWHMTFKNSSGGYNVDIYANGNLNSLISKTNFKNITETPYRGFYEFFQGAPLVSAPVLPATTLGYGCYESLFHNCSKLKNAPVLPATTLSPVCYYSMFYSCTSLEKAPELPATTLEHMCYGRMFERCSKLKYIKCLATSGIDTSGSTTDWVKSIGSNGTFVKASGATWGTGNNGIPSTWTVQEA